MADDLRARIGEALSRVAIAKGQRLRYERSDYVDAVMSVLDEAVAKVLHEYADRLDAIDSQCTALTGPYWYGQGWHQAADHLHDMADDHPGRMRREREATS